MKDDERGLMEQPSNWAGQEILRLREALRVTNNRVEELQEELAGVRNIFPWHRGDPDGLDVPVLQPRYDALRARKEELEGQLKATLESTAASYKALLADFNARTDELDALEGRRPSITLWVWKRDHSEITLRDMSGDPNWFKVEGYY